MPRGEIVARFESYASIIHAPAYYRVRVDSIERGPEGAGYRVQAGDATWEARHVVIAIGLYQRPKVPGFSHDISSQVTQVHSGGYRNPSSLPDGSVLVVGSGQSGCQIAEELYQSGRTVFLSVGSAGRAPRRYRGKDIFEWMLLTGFLDRTVAQLPSPEAQFAGNPQVSGRDGGRNLNLHQFARDGVVLLGRLASAEAGTLHIKADLNENLAKSDKFEADLVGRIDGYIERTGLDASREVLPSLRDGYARETISELDVRSAGIGSIVWAMGYDFDFGLVKLPAFDGRGFPVQRHGVTAFPGLFFVGLPWLDTQKSGLLVGVGEDADRIASAIAAQAR
jgi:putative flavoprotein involved in K+ transport